MKLKQRFNASKHLFIIREFYCFEIDRLGRIILPTHGVTTIHICVSSHIEELWYNKTECLWMTIYIYIYIYIYIGKQTSCHSCGATQARCMDRTITWSDIKQIEPKQLGFLIKAVYDILPTPVNLKLWGLSISNLYKACGKIATLKHILTGCQYYLRSYTWRHNEILGIIAEIAKMCCETANEIPCIKTNIQFVKEGNVSKTPHRNNRHKPTLLDGCTDWRVIADVDRQLAFPTEITSTRQRPDLVIWSVN